MKMYKKLDINYNKDLNKKIINYYLSILSNKEKLFWDYVFITARTNNQKRIYDAQLKIRQSYLPKQTKFITLVDHKERNIGSGGSTLNVIKKIKSIEKITHNLRILVIHSGGESKRVPQYSALGKLFSPIPKTLFNGCSSTLFDELLINLCALPSKIPPGFFFLSGDALLLFNPFKIKGKAGDNFAISFKENYLTGMNHGIFVSDQKGYIKHYLHKSSYSDLIKMKAVNKDGDVNIDTGALFFSHSIVEKLYSLINSNKKFNYVLSGQISLSLYFDFLYPMAANSVKSYYLNYSTDVSLNEPLKKIREKLWLLLRCQKMKVEKALNGKFLHFGTTNEILTLYKNKDLSDALLFDNNINSFSPQPQNSSILYNSIIKNNSIIKKGSFIEFSEIDNDSKVESNSFVSNLRVSKLVIPPNIVIHGMKLKNGKFVTRIFSTNANPKNDTQLFGFEIKKLLKTKKDYTLWNAPVYPVCDTLELALLESLNLYNNCKSKITTNSYLRTKKTSLKDSFLNCDYNFILDNAKRISDIAKMENLLQKVKNRTPFNNLDCNLNYKLTDCQREWLESKLNTLKPLEVIHLYYYIGSSLKGPEKEKYLNKSFDKIRNYLLFSNCRLPKTYRINNEFVSMSSPLRINFGGGWSDTPTYCNEYGGVVLNAAIKLNNLLPVKVEISKNSNVGTVSLESIDLNISKEFNIEDDLFTIDREYDTFSIHKASLIVSGLNRKINGIFILKKLLLDNRCGIKISCEVANVPCGSGLGTSSILCATMVKALYSFFNIRYDYDYIVESVLKMEQIMFTGGGWQDQAGGLIPGIKILHSKPSEKQKIDVNKVDISDLTKRNLKKRFFIVFTGKKRMARNILRKVVGNYLLNNQITIGALDRIKDISYSMAEKLAQGKLDSFARLMNKHWEYSKLIDEGSTNKLIDRIFDYIDDLVCGKMICGAGGGGFIQIMLKKGIDKKTLVARLSKKASFKKVIVYDIDFVY